MKFNFIYIIGILAGSMLLVSCDKSDEPDPNPKEDRLTTDLDANKFTIDNEAHYLNNVSAYVKAKDNSIGGAQFNLYLTEVTLTTTDGDINLIEGNGLGIKLEINSSSTTGIADGNYKFTSTLDQLTITDGELFVLDSNPKSKLTLPNLSEVITNNLIYFTDGNVDFTSDGSSKTIIFQLTTNTDHRIEGHFQGLVNFIN